MSSNQRIAVGLLAAASLHPACVMQVLPTNQGCQYQALSVVSHQLHKSKMDLPIYCDVIHLSHAEFPVL